MKDKADKKKTGILDEEKLEEAPTPYQKFKARFGEKLAEVGESGIMTDFFKWFADEKTDTRLRKRAGEFFSRDDTKKWGTLWGTLREFVQRDKNYWFPKDDPFGDFGVMKTGDVELGRDDPMGDSGFFVGGGPSKWYLDNDAPFTSPMRGRQGRELYRRPRSLWETFVEGDWSPGLSTPAYGGAALATGAGILGSDVIKTGGGWLYEKLLNKHLYGPSIDQQTGEMLPESERFVDLNTPSKDTGEGGGDISSAGSMVARDITSAGGAVASALSGVAASIAAIKMPGSVSDVNIGGAGERQGVSTRGT